MLRNSQQSSVMLNKFRNWLLILGPKVAGMTCFNTLYLHKETVFDKKSEFIDLYSLFEVMAGENRQLIFLFIQPNSYWRLN